jgi:hypothetical protein
MIIDVKKEVTNESFSESFRISETLEVSRRSSNSRSVFDVDLLSIESNPVVSAYEDRKFCLIIRFNE